MRNRLKELRVERHMSQRELGNALQISQETVSSYERGKHDPTLSRLVELSKILNTSCDYILGLSDIRCFDRDSCLINDEVLLIERLRRIPFHKNTAILTYMQELMK